MELIETIKVFKRVAELQSFSAAAKDFNTTQSSISRAVADLEENLGVLLFRRSTRRLHLTAEGQKLLLASEELLAKVEETLAVVRGEKQTLKGQLRVAASFSLGRIILTDLLDAFMKVHPDVKFHIRLSDGYVDLIEENIDVAIRMGNLQDSSLKAVRIGTARLKIYASRKYLKEMGRPKNIEDLHKHRLISFSRWARVPRWELYNEKKEKFDFVFDPYFEVDGVDMVRESVVRGLGIGLLPSWMLVSEEAAGTVECILDQASLDEIPVQAVTSGRKHHSNKQKIFIDFLRLKFESISAISLRKKST